MIRFRLWCERRRWHRENRRAANAPDVQIAYIPVLGPGEYVTINVPPQGEPNDRP